MTLNLRVNPDDKKRAEEVLKRLGIPMSTAINMYLKQIALTDSIPFSISLPKAPPPINAENMSADEMRMKIQEGLDDLEAGRVQEASTAFKKFRESL